MPEYEQRIRHGKKVESMFGEEFRTDDVFQARCECGWHGEIHESLYEANKEAEQHGNEGIHE